MTSSEMVWWSARRNLVLKAKQTQRGLRTGGARVALRKRFYYYSTLSTRQTPKTPQVTIAYQNGWTESAFFTDSRRPQKKATTRQPCSNTTGSGVNIPCKKRCRCLHCYAFAYQTPAYSLLNGSLTCRGGVANAPFANFFNMTRTRRPLACLPGPPCQISLDRICEARRMSAAMQIHYPLFTQRPVVARGRTANCKAEKDAQPV